MFVYMKMILILLLIFFPKTGWAQGICVSSFHLLENDITAITTGSIEKDQNGETAAIIKVVSPFENFIFTEKSMGIVKVKQQPGELWVYIPRGSMRISISHPELGNIENYYFPCSIEAGRTYEMIISERSEVSLSKQSDKYQYVVFQLNIKEATVELNGEKLEAKNGIVSKLLPYGIYDYRVSAPHYFVEAGNIDISNATEKKVLNINLRPDGSLSMVATGDSDLAKMDSNPTRNSPDIIAKLMDAHGNLIIKVGKIKLKMIKVEGGTFNMGESSKKSYEESPVHKVTLSTYYIGETEVTQELWAKIMGNNPSEFKGSKKPVEQVSWDDCQNFINQLNKQTGLVFRLPTEAEWEFAARGGNKSHGYLYSGGNTLNDVAWIGENSNKETHIVKTKKPNELGIYDMSGNVGEWCYDRMGDYSPSAQKDPIGPSWGTYRIARGGCYLSGEYAMTQVMYRYGGAPGLINHTYGFRLALW